MGKDYIKPQMVTIDIEVETIMMQGSFSDVKEGETSDNFDGNRRRGTWGNLWEQSLTSPNTPNNPSPQHRAVGSFFFAHTPHCMDCAGVVSQELGVRSWVLKLSSFHLLAND